MGLVTNYAASYDQIDSDYCFTGFPFAFGIFQDYYSRHEDFSESTGITAIGTTALGIMYLGMPFVMAILRLYPRIARWSPLIGLVIMCVSLAASSFSTSTWHLILTQGVMYAIGGSFGYNPCLLYMSEWFVRRRGLAYGVMWAGTGIGGFVFPLLFQWLLGQYGFRTTLRIWSVGLFIPVLALAYFIKPRLPISKSVHIRHAQARLCGAADVSDLHDTDDNRIDGLLPTDYLFADICPLYPRSRVVHFSTYSHSYQRVFHHRRRVHRNVGR